MVGYSKARSESIRPQTVKHLCDELDQVRLDGNHERADGELYIAGTQTLVKIAIRQGIRNRQAEMLDNWHDPLPRAEVV